MPKHDLLGSLELQLPVARRDEPVSLLAPQVVVVHRGGVPVLGHTAHHDRRPGYDAADFPPAASAGS
jgi:hypothetical protein